MSPLDAPTLLEKLQSKGVQFKITPDGLRYRECGEALTEEQHTYIDRHRDRLQAALTAQIKGSEERLEDHVPEGFLVPCWGRRNACRSFKIEEMVKSSASEFATIARQLRGTCGDCSLFHAQLDLTLREEERETRAAKKARTETQQATFRQKYFQDLHNEQEQEEAVQEEDALG